MRELLILSYAFALVLIASGSPTDRGECCLEKTVGGVTYTFVEKGDTGAYSCLSDCVYRKKGEMGPKFCFAKGEKEVQCEDIQSPVDPTAAADVNIQSPVGPTAAADVRRPDINYPDERICDGELQSFLSAANTSNTTLTIKCCKDGAKPSTCRGLPCLNKCDEDITCMIPVTDMENSKECKTNELFLLTNGPSCKTFADEGKCPKFFTNPVCACCKYAYYTMGNKCKYQCRCFGICSFFDHIGISTTFIHWCNGCPPKPTTLMLNPTVVPTVSGPQGSGVSTNSMDTTDLALSSTPPTTDATNGLAEIDCGRCQEKTYAADNDKDCKCKCTCAYITGCSGFNAILQWNRCWTDYSFCCECDAPNNYVKPCPETCNILNGNPIYGAPILQSTGKYLNRTDCNYA